MIPAYFGANSIILEIQIEIRTLLLLDTFNPSLPCFVSWDGKSTKPYR